MTNMKKRIAATLTAAILTTVLTVPAMATETPDKSVRVSSYKGSTLKVGEHRSQRCSLHRHLQRSGHDSSRAGADFLGSCRQVRGDCGDHCIQQCRGAWNCLKIRQEIIQLINQTRKDNGVPELPVSESLMNAAQVCSNRRYT